VQWVVDLGHLAGDEMLVADRFHGLERYEHDAFGGKLLETAQLAEFAGDRPVEQQHRVGALQGAAGLGGRMDGDIGFSQSGPQQRDHGPIRLLGQNRNALDPHGSRGGQRWGGQRPGVRTGFGFHHGYHADIVDYRVAGAVNLNGQRGPAGFGGCLKIRAEYVVGRAGEWGGRQLGARVVAGIQRGQRQSQSATGDGEIARHDRLHPVVLVLAEGERLRPPATGPLLFGKKFDPAGVAVARMPHRAPVDPGMMFFPLPAAGFAFAFGEVTVGDAIEFFEHASPAS
jgi:hypothetical protein